MTYVVIPVKQLSRSKSRLSTRLSLPEREALVLSLLRHTLEALKGVAGIERIGLATPDESLAGERDIDWIPDEGDLNATLRAAVHWAADGNRLVILPCDLPLLNRASLESLLDLELQPPSIALAATQDGGTGVLMLQPAGVMPPAFGPNSFSRHVELARRQTIGVHIVKDEGFARDLDTPEDLDALDGYLRPLCSRI